MRLVAFVILLCAWALCAYPCSIFMAVDGDTVLAANNEDYWLDAAALLWVTPGANGEHGRVTWGLAERADAPAFAQGGINTEGLFFDAAVTPEGDTAKLKGKDKAPENMGDALLAHNATVGQALEWLGQYDLRLLRASHLLLADATGDGAVVELYAGEMKVFRRQHGNYVGATNFAFADPARGNYPCPRFAKIDDYFKKQQGPVNVESMRALMQSVAVPRARDEAKGKDGGTLYSTLCDLKTGRIWFYRESDFSGGAEATVDALLAQGKAKYTLAELIEQNRTKQ